MKKEKRQFIEEYIAKVEQAIKAYNEADVHIADQLRNDLFDLLVEIRNIFESDIPNIDSAIFLRDGTAIRDANSVLGILKFYLINSEDGPADQCSPASQTIVGDKIFISHRSVDKKFAEIIEIFLTSCGVPADKFFVPLSLVMILKKRFQGKSKLIFSKVRLILSCYLKITTRAHIVKMRPV